jgi:hypothetical protein
MKICNVTSKRVCNIQYNISYLILKAYIWTIWSLIRSDMTISSKKINRFDNNLILKYVIRKIVMIKKKKIINLKTIFFKIKNKKKTKILLLYHASCMKVIFNILVKVAVHFNKKLTTWSFFEKKRKVTRVNATRQSERTVTQSPPTLNY